LNFLLVNALGEIDEASCMVGLATIKAPKYAKVLKKVQGDLLALSSSLVLDSRFGPDRGDWLNLRLVELQNRVKVEPKFVLPQGTEKRVVLHLARVVVRRAHRALWAYRQKKPRRAQLDYLNCLSTVLFLMAEE
jgi:ATP:cob(I)alamin adenosyltransferase